MDKSNIAIFAAVMAVAVIRLYQKYKKKNQNKSASNANSPSGTSMPSSLKDDDYEPYSKK
jgi:mannose/fructose/N-acetylgalactosamine-specific phosphotransferase system component IIC